MSAGPPFALDAGDVLDPEPRAVYEDGAVFGCVGPVAEACRVPPGVVVAWLDEPPDATLEQVVEEELRGLEPGTLLVDYEPVTVGGHDAVRTLALHPGQPPGAREQWRLLAGGRRWSVSALTALEDQARLGPALAAVAGSLRLG